MKICLLYLGITLSLILQIEESITGKYVINSNDNFSVLELKNDSTFIYKDRGISTWTWYTFDGIWEYSKNKLILIEEFKGFNAEKYLVEDRDNEDQSRNIKAEIRYHIYEVKEGKLIGASENLIDAEMVFAKIKKND